MRLTCAGASTVAFHSYMCANVGKVTGMTLAHQPSMWDLAEEASLGPLAGQSSGTAEPGAWVDHLPAGSPAPTRCSRCCSATSAGGRTAGRCTTARWRCRGCCAGTADGSRSRTPCSPRRARRSTPTTAPELGERFVSAGMCLYRDGRDSVAWHGDRIGRGRSSDTMVAIVSFGSPRPLMLRPVGAGGACASRSATATSWSWAARASAPGSTASPRRPSRWGRGSACSSGRAAWPERAPDGRDGGRADPPARPPRGRVWFSMRRADREGLPDQPPGWGVAGNRRSVGHPARDGGPERVEFLRVRSLRTQQRAESQCQVITPCRVLRSSGGDSFG